MTGQLDGKMAELFLHLCQISVAEVDDNLIGEFLVSRLQTEVSGVRKRSVVAIIGVADDGGQQFPRSRIEFILGFHQSDVKRQRGTATCAVKAHRFNDVGNTTSPCSCGFVDFGDLVDGRLGGNQFKKWHGQYPC